ncbi:MAG: ABC transporter ATP-binding protein [Ardenticatenaceae bacterium]|nr:ABC transporter ATP-binding protein [Anaerolineales bacterium]MCB8920584.1 ABC transporter ATP-binding protein [Ardenticatenaceae bacterium]MCB8990208.1 ABC transporter ATP-binding protein [Ardenticatenaceae bacterium]MCB9003000.1 ABC transporter ATP-binding protein [Ardenticatenaceae bacterium]
MTTLPAIQTENLGRIYRIRGSKKEAARELVALRDVNLTVQPGELFGLLGPNGAGKTTLIKILTTLLSPSNGRALIAGLDVTQQPGQVRQLINMVSGGETSGYGLLTVRENLWMFAQFYGIPSAEANRRIRELLEIVGLSERINTKSSDLSTGLRQKMNIVRGFLTDPDILFLDEPTLGLDVGASRDVRQFIRRWMDEQPTRTLLLTTHYMVEADELCDRVAIINQGRVLACDTPANLKRNLQRDAIFRLEVSPPDEATVAALATLSGMRHFVRRDEEGTAVLEMILHEEAALAQVINTLTQSDIRILNLQKREPTLEDVFVDLVGHSMAEAEHENNPAV